MRKLCGEARAAPEAATSLLILACSPRSLLVQNSLREREGHQPRDPTGPRDRRQLQDDVLSKEKAMSETNKDIAVAFYKKALFEGQVEEAFRLYAVPTYRQHNPLIEDGMEGLRKFVPCLRSNHRDARCATNRHSP